MLVMVLIEVLFLVVLDPVVHTHAHDDDHDGAFLGMQPVGLLFVTIISQREGGENRETKGKD
ncbi:unnamed protein product [Camellia sinensis]